jgi:hypothetical protein
VLCSLWLLLIVVYRCLLRLIVRYDTTSRNVKTVTANSWYGNSGIPPPEDEVVDAVDADAAFTTTVPYMSM